MRFRLVLVCALSALSLAATAPAASANAFEELFDEYRKTHQIDGCKHSSKKLKQAKREVPNDIEQYASDFPAALDAALEQRTSGRCARKGSGSGGSDSGSAPAAPAGGTTGGTPGAAAPATTPGATPAPSAPQAQTQTTAPQPTPNLQPAPAVADDAIPVAARTVADDGGDAPAPLVLLAIIGGLLLAGAAAWAAVRYWAFEPAWLARFKHAGAEVGWRASAAWAEFTDWVRLGR